MKAVILAAGRGERLGKVTQNIPKPMIKYRGKPILEHNIELCKKYGISDIFINLYHLPDIIISYFGDGSRFGVKITYSLENCLLGTSGAVRRISKKYWNLHEQSDIISENDSFFVIYGDNYSEYNLERLRDFSFVKDSILTIAFHYRDDVSTSGVAEFDKEGRILSFKEKPKEGTTNSHWVNAGIYFCKPEIIKHIPNGISDFSNNIFPELILSKIPIYGICEDKVVKAFDTPEMLNQNT